MVLYGRCDPILAQEGDGCSLSIQGRVLDGHDRQPLAFAEVYLPALGKGAVADENGSYRISGLCRGSYLIRTTHLGCEPSTRTVVIEKPLELDLFLEHHAQELHEMEVVRERPDEHVGQAHTEIDRAVLEKSGGRTLAEILSTVSGVTILSSGPTINKPVIHGLSGNRVLILNQGIRQEDQQWGTEHAPNLDPYSSDRITVVKGAASVQYGSDAIGGVVITEPVELPRGGALSGQLRGVGSFNGRGGGGNGFIQGGLAGIRGLGWRLQGSGRYLGDSRASNYFLSNTGVREGGASMALGFRDHLRSAKVYYSWFTRELGILRASHIGNLTDLNNAIESGTPWYVGDFTYTIDAPRQQVQHHLLKVDASQVIGERGSITFLYGYQADDRQEYDIRRGGRSGLPALDLFLTTHTADVAYKHWLGARVHGKAGVSGLLQENRNIDGTGVRPLIPNYTRQSGGVFLLEHFPVNDRLEFEAGARWEVAELAVVKYTVTDERITPSHRFTNYAASVGSNWQFREGSVLRFDLSSAYRPPHVSELYSEGLHHGAAAIEVGDPTLRSERSYKAVLDLEASGSQGRLMANVTVYGERIDDYIYLRPNGVQLTVRGAFPVFDYVATDAQLVGADLGLRYRFAEHWTWQVRASSVRGRDLVRDEWLFQMPSDRLENTLLFALPTACKWTDLEVGSTLTSIFQQERIPTGLDYALPPDSYHLFGITGSVVRSIGTAQLRIGLRGNNLFNKAYRDYMDRFRYYADARGVDLTLWISYTFGNQP